MPDQPFSFQYPPGATPLDPNEIDGLLVDSISTQGELNQLEQENILAAKTWVTGKPRRKELDDTWLRDLHKRMFNQVWKWAGQYRRSDKSVGGAWQDVPTEVAKLLGDTRYWIDHATYPWDELGARFHHRLVAIHAFPNGNGRHARLTTDLLLEAHGQQPFSWGASLAAGAALEQAGAARAEYLDALREADAKKLARLIRFVRT